MSLVLMRGLTRSSGFVEYFVIFMPLLSFAIAGVIGGMKLPAYLLCLHLPESYLAESVLPQSRLAEPHQAQSHLDKSCDQAE